MNITRAQYHALVATKLCDTDIIESIQSSIVSTERLLDGVEPITVDKEYKFNEIKCYAYALGIMYQEQFWVETYAHNSITCFPGFTVKNTFGFGGYEQIENIIELVKQDLDNLRIGYKEISLNGDISLIEGEYLVKVFIKKGCRKSDFDFHFIRYSPKADIWFHKMGYTHPQSIVYHNYQEPVGMEIEFEKNSIYRREPKIIRANHGCYEPVGYFAIKEPW